MPLRYSFLILLLLPGFAGNASEADTLQVYFPTGVSRLSAGAVKTLDSAIYYKILNRQAAVEILGYADFVGSSASNETLSGARAEAVKTFLLQNGFSEAKIIRTLAKGEIAAGSSAPRQGVAGHRRVDIILNGNTAKEQMAAPAASASPPPAASLPFPPSRTTATTSVAEVLNQTPVGSSFQLSKIFFPAGQHVMYEDSKPELEDLIEALKEKPGVRIRVEGHVCCIDTNRAKDALDEQTHEYRLSGNRARFVAQYLIRGGIDASRISHVGYGKRFAIVYYESTPEEAAANRRVEIRILEK